MAELAALAEAAGWDGMFLEDYVVYQGQVGTPTYDPWIVLAAMAMATTRIRLGTTVTPVPRRRHPDARRARTRQRGWLRGQGRWDP